MSYNNKKGASFYSGIFSETIPDPDFDRKSAFEREDFLPEHVNLLVFTQLIHQYTEAYYFNYLEPGNFLEEL